MSPHLSISTKDGFGTQGTCHSHNMLPTLVRLSVLSSNNPSLRGHILPSTLGHAETILLLLLKFDCNKQYTFSS
jgi:hypothetical protein